MALTEIMSHLKITNSERSLVVMMMCFVASEDTFNGILDSAANTSSLSDHDSLLVHLIVLFKLFF